MGTLRFEEKWCSLLSLMFNPACNSVQYNIVILSHFSADLEFKGKEEVIESQGFPEDSSHMSSASSHCRRIRWLLSSASLGNIEEEGVSFEPRLESSASGAMLEVRISIKNISFVSYIIIWLCLTRTENYQIHEFDWLKRILTAV